MVLSNAHPLPDLVFPQILSFKEILLFLYCRDTYEHFFRNLKKELYCLLPKYLNLRKQISWRMNTHTHTHTHVFVVQSLSCVWLCTSVDCSMLGFPIPHCLLEFAQIQWKRFNKGEIFNLKSFLSSNFITKYKEI